ncbi:MAG: HNH endonuclease signature motif containing protein [Eubacteriales bacterium]|nr:HNH endonuclease signature motif containing protein [Eubacteriales bacterium]
MKKDLRIQTYNKYDGRCAYCGKKIEYKEMQVDHIVPLVSCSVPEIANNITNLNPSCRRCNHYKRSSSLEVFRHMLMTLHERVQDIYICKVAVDYGIIKMEPWDGKFYFERCEDSVDYPITLFEEVENERD